ncbi:MAG: hypothetical protein IPL43_11010 [Micropruina sp.]|nr:hypothetical protein [Micropruina sp.]
MSGSQGSTSLGVPASAGVGPRGHWRLVALLGASVSAALLLIGGAGGALLLATLGMLVAAGHLLRAKPWQRGDHDRIEER